MLMAMQKHIFMDTATMHLVYINSHLAAIEEIVDVGLIDTNTASA